MHSTNSHLSISISLLSESHIQITVLSQIFSYKPEACAWEVKGRESLHCSSYSCADMGVLFFIELS